MWYIDYTKNFFGLDHGIKQNIQNLQELRISVLSKANLAQQGTGITAMGKCIGSVNDKSKKSQIIKEKGAENGQ